MNSVQSWLEAYGESHQNPINKRIHWICVPLIMLSLLGVLWPLQFSFISQSEYFNATTVLIFFAGIYYFKLSFSMGVGMLAISLFMILLITYLNDSMVNSLSFYIVVFILAWIGQFVGHKIEKKKPSFFEDLQFLLIGPLWLLSQLYNFLNIKY